MAKTLAEQGSSISLVLFYGSDQGLCLERAQEVLQLQSVTLGDSFRVSRLTGAQIQEDSQLLATEVASLCFTGGRRLVWLTEVEERSGSTALQALLKKPQGEGLIVAMAGELSAKSALRSAAKSSPFALLVPCYPDTAREIELLAKENFSRNSISIDRPAMQTITELLGGDRLVTRSEIEKLALFAGAGGRLSQAEVLIMLGDTASVSIQDAIAAAASGSFVLLDRALQRVFAEGESAVGIIRSAMSYFMRLQNLVELREQGQSATAVVNAHRPPIFWREKDQMIANVEFWSLKTIERVLTLLLRAETLCKSTGFPDQTIASQTLIQIAYLGRRDASR
ncbi:MAG: DNA polymerase III subunit delta [Alphaproteobacteria bacterium]|nr:DNA polymerase III subunit delta [Alphaproteobacteria bacterium]